MDIKNEIDKRYDTPLDELDIDGYINWVLNYKAKIRAEKKAKVMRLVEYKEKNIATYRRAIKEVLYDTKYWKEATEQDKDNFPFWRKNQFECETRLFGRAREKNAMPLKEHIRLEHLETEDFLNNSSLLLKVYDYHLPDDFYELALLAGKIDYLHWLNGLVEDTNNILSNLSNDKIGDILKKALLEGFKEIEQSLCDTGWIDKNRNWLKNPVNIADFVNTLIIKKYTKDISRTAIRYFFQKRYNLDFTDQFKPAKLKARTINDFDKKIPSLM